MIATAKSSLKSLFTAYPKIRKINGRYKKVWGYTCQICEKRNLIGTAALNHYCHEHWNHSDDVNEVCAQMEMAERRATTGLHLAGRTAKAYDQMLKWEVDALIKREHSLCKAFAATMEALLGDGMEVQPSNPRRECIEFFFDIAKRCNSFAEAKEHLEGAKICTHYCEYICKVNNKTGIAVIRDNLGINNYEFSVNNLVE